MLWRHVSGGRSPLQEHLVAASVGKACPPHPQILHQSQILDLVTDQYFIKSTCDGEQRESRLSEKNVKGSRAK